MDIGVGAALRKRRNELGMTLRQVAEQTELTSGYLSQVENDHVSPSLKSLRRMGDVLRIPLFQLLSPSVSNPVVRSDERTVLKWFDTGDELLLLTPYRDWQMMPFYSSIPPGETREATRQDSAREEWMFVLSGSVQVALTNDQRHVLFEGDAIHFESSRLEAISNPTEETVTFIGMMTPPPMS